MENPRSDNRVPRRKPLVSQTGPTEDIRFRDFGSLNMGKQSGVGPITSAVGNVLAAFIVFVIWKAQPVVVKDKKVVDLTYAAIKPLPPPPPPPKITAPKLPPPPPKPVPLPPVKVEAPVPVKLPTPPVPKPQPVAQPNKPAPPVLHETPPAPKITNVNLGRAASVPNNDAHPAAVSLGQANNPIAPSNRPATANVNLGQAGLPGMPGSNTGRGPASTAVNLGSGQPGGHNLGATGVRQVAGIPRGGVEGGVPGARGAGGATQVALGQRPPAPTATTPVIASMRAKPPQVVFQPKPQYTADATQNHIEGTIHVRIRVSSSGQVTVVGLEGAGLGHGLDQSALNAAQQIRFRPAIDANGNPTDWEGVVRVQFQIAD